MNGKSTIDIYNDLFMSIGTHLLKHYKDIYEVTSDTSLPPMISMIKEFCSVISKTKKSTNITPKLFLNLIEDSYEEYFKTLILSHEEIKNHISTLVDRFAVKNYSFNNMNAFIYILNKVSEKDNIDINDYELIYRFIILSFNDINFRKSLKEEPFIKNTHIKNF